ncbi:MAG: tight adherence protein [Candidatus Binataceae bacterium]|jgi:tight adherence protein B|nr:tight adherence protein [Candidatus Binataceae bacterium]
MQMDLMIATGTFALVLAVGIVLMSMGRSDSSRATEMLEDVTRLDIDEIGEGLMRTGGRKTRRKATNRREEILEVFYRIHLLNRLEQSMWQASLYMRVSEMLLIIVLMFGLGFTVAKFFLHDTIIALVISGALGAAPLIYIRFRRLRRMREFTIQLPSALDLIKSSLEAGHSLVRGLQVLVQEFADPLGGEFRTVLEQSRLGMPLTRALEEMLKRMPEEDLRLLVVAIKVQSEVGSSLAQIIGRLSEIVRTRQRLQQQIRTMTAQSRMSGMVVGLLPAIVLSIFSLVQPGYARVLFYDPSGVMALKLAIGLDLMAFLTIRRILKVDF